MRKTLKSTAKKHSSHVIKCRTCKKSKRVKTKRQKICNDCKESSAAPVAISCKYCGANFDTKDRRKKICESCSIYKPFFASPDYHFLLRNFERIGYLEQFPPTTEAMIDLLLYRRWASKCRGSHVVDTSKVLSSFSGELEQDASLFEWDDWACDFVPTLEWKTHHDLDLSHFYPSNGTPEQPHLKGMLVVENLMMLTSSLNRSMKNRHKLGTHYFDSTYCTYYESDHNKVLQSWLRDTYDLPSINRALGSLSEFNTEAPEEDFQRIKLNEAYILHTDLKRLVEVSTGAALSFFKDTLARVERWLTQNDLLYTSDFWDELENLHCESGRLEKSFVREIYSDVAHHLQHEYTSGW